MKLTALLLLFVLVQHLSAQPDLTSYPLPENHKVWKTSSSKLNDNTSLHFAITKNKETKKFIWKPFLINNEGVKDLSSLSFNKDPKIISIHLSANILTLLYKTDEEDIYGMDINITNDTNSSPEKIIIDEYKTRIVSNGATYFFGEKDNAFFIVKVSNTNDIVRKEYRIKEVYPYLKKQIKKKGNAYIKTDEFVDIGSVSLNQIFKYEDVFYVTYDDKENLTTYIYELPFTEIEAYEVGLKKFSLSLSQETKKIFKSFLMPGYLFTLFANKKEVLISIINYNTGEEIKSFNYTKGNFNPYHKYYFLGEEVKSLGNNIYHFSAINRKKPLGNEYFKSFFKQPPFAPPTRFPFLTVNKTSDHGYLIEAGNITHILYGGDPFFHDHMMMWQHQQMINNSIRNFQKSGPNLENYEENLPFNETGKKTSIKLSLDSSFNVTEKMSASVYDDPSDNDEIIKKIEKVKTYTMVSSAKFGEYVRYMFFQKLSGNFYIKEDTKNTND